jgi:hypothetical protein
VRRLRHAVEAAGEGGEEHGAAVGEHPRLAGEEVVVGVGVTAFGVTAVGARCGKLDRGEERQVGEAPDLEMRAEIGPHVGAGGDDAVERREHRQTVGPELNAVERRGARAA